MRPRLALLALALLVPQKSSADTLSGTKSSEMFERGDTIELRIDHGHATFVVRRTFENRSTLHDQAMLDITDLPEGAVASGLRTLGGTSTNPIWYAAELLDAEVAAKKYQELTGIGGYYPKDPALLSWRSASHLALQVFPVAPKSQKTVEYTMEAPTRWVAGRHEIEVPRMGLSSFAPTLTVKATHPDDSLFLDGMPIAGGDTRKLLGSLTLTAAPKDPPRLGGRFSSSAFGKGRAVVHTAVEVSKTLSEKPKDAYVIVLLDGSRSLTDADRAAEIAGARAYLSHLPDAHVQLVVFDRAVHPLEASFVTTAQALDDLKKLTITPKNGSDLDVALADAQKRIADAPKGAPRRLLLLTDLMTRSALVPERIKGLDQSKAILHVATVRSDSKQSSVSRDDFDPWSTVPRSTGGVLWDARVRTTLGPIDLAVFEEWARPLRIDRVSIAGVGLTTSGMSFPDSLAEGEAIDDLLLQPTHTPSVEVKGVLWSAPISAVLTSNAAEEKLWAGLTVASSLLSELKDPEIAALAFKGGVVSPMTSYLAVEPGVRPSTEGLEWGQGLGMSGIGAGGGGSGTGYGLGKAILQPDRMKFLRDSIRKVVATCGGGEVRTRLETTVAEIVAVDVAAKVPNPKLESCVREGVFGLELPTWFDAAWRSWDVTPG